MSVLLIRCRSITRSAIDMPKNLCGIFTGVMLMNGTVSTASLAIILSPTLHTLRSSAMPSPSQSVLRKDSCNQYSVSASSAEGSSP